MNMFLRTDQPQCGFSNSKQHSNVHLHKPPSPLTAQERAVRAFTWTDKGSLFNLHHRYFNCHLLAQKLLSLWKISVFTWLLHS